MWIVGVTIPDVVFVIDTCKVKQTQYKEKSGLRSLVETTVSKASARQRAGYLLLLSVHFFYLSMHV